MRYKTNHNNKVEAIAQPFTFTTIATLRESATEQRRYCVDGILPDQGLSVLAGKPKAGKSTLARQLAVAVAQGQPFLGKATDQGTVFYFALEEKEAEIAEHFSVLGLRDEDPLRILCGSVPRSGALECLTESLRQATDVKLVIIDPMFKFISGVKDTNDYLPVNNALDTFLQLAREQRTHILLVHHMKKCGTEDVMDGALGSTAIAAAADTFIALQNTTGGVRTLCTRQRYGHDMPETILQWDDESRSLSLGLSKEEANDLAADRTLNRIETSMIEYVQKHPHSTQDSILTATIGNAASKKRVLRTLIDDGMFVPTGGGVKGDPYTYTFSEMPVDYSEACMVPA